MRYVLGIFAAAFMLIGVASASDTGFGDWGTTSYDEVMDSYVVNYATDFSPAPVVDAVSGISGSSSSSCSFNSYGYGPVQYGDDDWDWYSL